jgi:hypothetical protein
MLGKLDILERIAGTSFDEDVLCGDMSLTRNIRHVFRFDRPVIQRLAARKEKRWDKPVFIQLNPAKGPADQFVFTDRSEYERHIRFVRVVAHEEQSGDLLVGHFHALLN